MSESQRAGEFKRKIQDSLGAGSSVFGPNLGFSNRGRFHENGVLVGCPNLERFLREPAPSSFATTTCIRLLPTIELHLSIATTSETHSTWAKLTQMVESDAQATPNNTAVLLSNDGELMLGFKVDKAESVGKRPDRVFVAVHPASQAHHAVVRATLDVLANQVGKERVEIISPWGNVDEDDGRTQQAPQSATDVILSKPFLLLSGISGTGKTRFVREQARMGARVDSSDRPPNYELVCVRPDWHEPSDLLGYVTRLSGERFVVTPFLRFMVKAWREAVAVPETLELKPLEQIMTFWLCLDEMNLAPVEQYFSDFLSIMETRRWSGSVYDCDPILPVHKLGLSADALEGLRKDLDFDDGDALWKRFSMFGIPIPPNLVVVGTVNMDETTHGFSRKVIDRALTFDFGVFFPNKFDAYFAPSVAHARLQFPRWASVTEADLGTVVADPGGAKSVAFLDDVNSVLEGTPFQLAFRALNELLVSLRSFAPDSESDLFAVWDDFVMTKVLPRLEGDGEKLKATSSGKEQGSLLTKLAAKLAKHGLTQSAVRPDLYRRAVDAPITVAFRSPEALARMQERLTTHGFTSFWP